MQYISGIKYNLSEYNRRCPVCDRQSRNDKCLSDHIFHRNLKDDKEHAKFAQFLRNMYEYEFLQKAKKRCPICNRLCSRNLGTHLAQIKDVIHNEFYKKQKEIIVKLFLEHKSPSEIEKFENVYLDKRTICRHLNKELVYKKFSAISKDIFSSKRKSYWSSFSLEERKNKMEPVRNAEWGNLTPEQRKKHPWVIAGRRASLESCIRGSKNQKYAFELLKTKLPDYNWIYNYTLNEDWQIDIAAPEQKIFIEWDGKFHRVAVFGEKHLNNIKNKDNLKNGLVTKQLNGTMIRVNDGGRFNKRFVEEKVEQIVKLLDRKFEGQIMIL